MLNLSESSNVRLGLAVGMVLSAGTLVWQIAGIKADLRSEMAEQSKFTLAEQAKLAARVDEKYVSRELFNVRMDELTRDIADIKSELRRGLAPQAK